MWCAWGQDSAREATGNGNCPDFKLHGHHYPFLRVVLRPVKESDKAPAVVTLPKAGDAGFSPGERGYTECRP